MSSRSLTLLAGLVMLAGCSVNKNTFTSRTFHRLTTRDNGWFNANEKLKETVASMEKAYVDDFDELLPVFIYGTEDQAKGMVPDLEKCIEKCSNVIERHSMDLENKEQNTWIDDAWFVIGRSHFYKRSYFDAERTFDYIGRRYKGQNRQLESKLWLARTAMQNEQYAKAQSVLDEVKGRKTLPKRFPHDELSAIQADLNIRRGKVDDAIVDLEHAVEIARDRRRRVRWMFILAQLYEAKGMEEKAIAQFDKVAHSNPPYELGFHAQIHKALSFDRGSSAQLRKMLQRMLRDEKNKDHYDMIEYALAEIDLKENRDSSAIAHLKRSTRVSTSDTRQKAKSFLRLADLYFDDRQYPSAQQYYDSTSALITEVHKRYEEVKTRADVLGELVEQLDIIAREDSLQAFAQLDEGEREKRVKRMIRDRERAEEEKAAAEEEARTQAQDQPSKPQETAAGGDRNAWYFYNPVQLARGLSEFKKKWGARPNEDDWRRKDKSGSAVAEPETADVDEDGEDGEKKKDGEPAWKDPASYLKDLPLDSTSLEASNAKVCAALYISGTIYKEKLKDIDNAIESFEVLNGRFEECRYTPESYYQLYRIYLAKEKSGSFFSLDDRGSAFYANVIKERWPDSEFARLVDDPNQLMADEQRRGKEESDYALLYQRYRESNYPEVVAGCNFVITETPKNHLIPKYHLLRALAVGGMRQMEAFRTALQEVIAKFPGTDEAKAAQDILAQLDKQAGTKPGAQPPPDAAPAPTYATGDGPHYVVVIYPSADGDINPIKARISDFGLENFRAKSFQVTNSLLDQTFQVIKINPFANREEAMTYYELFIANRVQLGDLMDRGYTTFAISAANYAAFYKSKDVDTYAAFFQDNYLKEQ